MSGLTGTFLGIGEAGAGLSNAVQEYRDNEARYRAQRQREEMTAQQIKLTEAENQEAQERIRQEKIADFQRVVKMQRDAQIRQMLPKYLSAASPEDRQVISGAVDLGVADPESALAIILNYYNAKAAAGWKKAQAIALAELAAKKEQDIQDRQDARAKANRDAAAARQTKQEKFEAEQRKQSAASAMDRTKYTVSHEDARSAAKAVAAGKKKTAKTSQQVQNSLAGLDVLSGALDKLSKLTNVLNGYASSVKISRVLSMESSKGVAGDAVTKFIARTLTPDEQAFVVAFNQARDSIQALRTFSGNPRSTAMLYNSFIKLLPDPLQTANGAMGLAKIRQLQDQIKTVRARIAAGQPASGSTAAAPGLPTSGLPPINWGDMPNAPR